MAVNKSHVTLTAWQVLAKMFSSRRKFDSRLTAGNLYHFSQNMFYLVGLGLGNAEDITVKGLNVVKSAKRVYLEAYTSILTVGKDVLVSDNLKPDHAFRLLEVHYWASWCWDSTGITDHCMTRHWHYNTILQICLWRTVNSSSIFTFTNFLRENQRCL